MHKFYEELYLTEINTIITGAFEEDDKNCVQAVDGRRS